ncbi:hypothetical protein B9Z19DRAFT_1099110 [Tuber borchii]|uniref:Zn(2)-C6 fungal-type domain-containing protein n=1 Tax=Tuber borchii TaxID=42251 RepID=A0A2T7A459_TUBBO|nr:hypothetical protein B9Z19DRAFT_1099110 [Tuber borchii]
MQQSINLSPTDLGGARENHRNYVFVDEHNRHKRLKVMRACEGCRRRKIKCDAATTNTWPCSACVRLKLHCVPPMVQYDRDFAPSQPLEQDGNGEFDNSSGSGEEEMISGHLVARKQGRNTLNYHPRDGHGAYRNISPPEQHHSTSHGAPPAIAFSGIHSGDDIEPPLSGMHFPTPVYQTQAVMRPQEQWPGDTEYVSTAHVSGVLGQLKIDDSGVANYISAQGRRLAETPAYEPWTEELEPNPSFLPVQHDFAVRIHQEDMPTEDEAQEMFGIFFNHIHPYIPIVNKAAFYRQWNTSRDSISPLLLETIFACAGRLTTDPSKGLKWMGMATRHVDCFLDVPRLSTVQALLLLLKARESAPQRGYFFRSWMSVVSIIAMARDLGLDKHHALHKQGIGCGESTLDCMTRTRVWQACFVYELMICAPQGRDIMQCNPDSIDLQTPIASPDCDENEVAIYESFIYFVWLVKNIRRMNDVHAKLKSTPNWRNDPQFLDSGSGLDAWAYKLPANLRVNVSTDLAHPGPQVDSHFTGNLQMYYHLTRIMLHRPALAYGKTFSLGGEWKTHMTICTNSAKSICRLEETVFEQYGMLGLQCMLRGVNFTIYTLLTCAMIHLIAATCPDPEFNHDAKEYFTRTMRILENCIDSSASSEVKGQIETLREAFSLDVNRPFVLNPNFPFYPGVSGPVDPSITRAYTQGEGSHSTLATGPVNYPTHPLSPPHSAGGSEPKGESPAAVQSLVMLAAGQGAQSSAPIVDTLAWNPSRLFDNWNAAFGVNGTVSAAMPQAQMATHESGLVDPLGGGRPPSSSSYVPATVGVSNSFVSPGMWQDSVAAAAVFSDSHKRPFPFGGETVWHPSPSTGRDPVSPPALHADAGRSSR